VANQNNERLKLLKLVFQIFLSFSIFFGGSYVVLSGDYPQPVVTWATGLVGVVVGYWIK
jgi:hypothetical protein